MTIMNEKTNVMRILDKAKIDYKSYYYGDTGAISGVEVANVLNEDVNKVFKTLVTVSKSKKYYVFMIPVQEELDLKKAAKVVNEKSIDMIPQKELLPLTGYIHGGCSPIGLKKQFSVTIHESALDHDSMIFSGGKIGYQVELNPNDISKVIRLSFDDLIVK